MYLFLAMAWLASPTSVFPWCTPRLWALLWLPGLRHGTATFDGWLRSYLESRMIYCQYDQPNIVTSILLAGLCYRYVRRIFFLCNEITSIAFRFSPTKFLIIIWAMQPSADTYTIMTRPPGHVILFSLTSIGILLENVGQGHLRIVRRLRGLLKWSTMSLTRCPVLVLVPDSVHMLYFVRSLRRPSFHHVW